MPEAEDAVPNRGEIPERGHPMDARLRATRSVLLLALAVITLLSGFGTSVAQHPREFVPVTDQMLQNPAPGDWLMWRRTLDSWGYSPLDEIHSGNVGELRLVWSRALTNGFQSGTPLVYDGVMYMPNPDDVIQALHASTGDVIWEHRRPVPDDIGEYVLRSVATNNRNIAIYDTLIIDTSVDDHVFALDAQTGRMVWETEVLDYRVHPALQGAGPIITNGKVISGRSCAAKGGPQACVVTAHEATTGAELWRRRLIPAPGEPGDETWGDVPYEKRLHVGSWMPPSYDPALNLIYVGTSVTSPAPKFMVGGVENQHLYNNSTLALDADTGEIVWYYQHLNDHWDLDHPFERLLVDTAVAPDPSAVSWINPRLRSGDVRRVVTGIPGKTGVVYTLDRATGEFLWATPSSAALVPANKKKDPRYAGIYRDMPGYSGMRPRRLRPMIVGVPLEPGVGGMGGAYDIDAEGVDGGGPDPIGDGVVADWAGAVDAASPAGVCGVKAFGDLLGEGPGIGPAGGVVADLGGDLARHRPQRRHLDPARRGARRGRFITPRL